jgi:hypothetical protein
MFGFVVCVVVVLLKKSILERIICVVDAAKVRVIWLSFVIIVMKQKFYVHEL